MSDYVDNPYVGPRTFEEKDSPFFFGREREARELLSFIIAEPLVVFYAQSGAGKSSLINTRLIPGLREEGFTVLPVGRVGGVLPEGVGTVDNIFVFNLLLSLDPTRNAAPLSQTSLTEHLQAHKATMADPNQARVLIIDQFEEIINTHVTRWPERQAFFEQLGQAMKDDPLLWVVLTLREDFIAALDPYAPLLPGKLRARFYMERMQAEAAQEAIEQPALQGGRPFAPGTARLLVDNLRQIRTQEEGRIQLGQFVEPVQLQVVCYQLWENLKGRPQAEITQQDLEELGDVDTALGQFYEQAIAKVLQGTNRSEIEIRNWFDRQLITEAGTRGTVYQGATETACLDNRAVHLLADQFLLRAEIRAGGTWYELVHDRLVTPILQANQAWRARQSPLVQAAETWNRSGRKQELLYRDEQLRGVLASVDLESQEETVREFLTASQQAQSQRELAETKALMEEERQRAEAEAQTAKLLRRLTTGLIVLFVIAFTAAALATSFGLQASRSAIRERGARATAEADQAAAQAARAEAEENFQAAETARAEAEENFQAAEAARAEAESQRAQAEEQRRIAQENAAAAEQARAEAESQRALAEASEAEANRLRQVALAQSLAAIAPSIIDRTNDTELATLLAVQALHVNAAAGGEIHGAIDSVVRDTLSRRYFNTTFTGHPGFVTAVAFSPDGQILATGDDTGTLILWKLASHSADFALVESSQTRIIGLSFSPDGGRLAVSSLDNHIYIWDVALLLTADGRPEPLNTLTGYSDSIRTMTFSANGQNLIAISGVSAVLRWNLAERTSAPAFLLALSRSDNYLLALSQYGQMVVSADAIGALRLHDLNAAGAPPRLTFTSGQSGLAVAVAFRPDQQQLAAAYEDGTIRIWNLINPTIEPIRLLPQNSPIRSIVFSPDGVTIASISDELSDLSIQLWDVRQPAAAPVALTGHSNSINAVAFSPAGDYLASTSHDFSVRLWDMTLPEGASIVLGGTEPTPLSAVATSTDGQYIFATQDWQNDASNDTLSIYRWVGDEPPAGPALLEIPTDNETAFTLVALDPDSQHLATVDEANNLSIWDLDAAGAAPALLERRMITPTTAMVFTADGQTLATAAGEIIYLWSAASLATPFGTLSGHHERLTALAFSPDGRTLAGAAADNVIYLWEVDRGDIVERLIGHKNIIRALAYSPDGQTLASGGNDREVHLWSLTAEDSARNPHILPGHEDWIYSLAFSPDGQTLASAGADQSIRLWPLNAQNPGANPTILAGHRAQVRSVVFGSDGQRLISASSDQTVRLWPTQLDTFISLACSQVRRNLTWQEWQRYMGGGAYALTCPTLPPHPSFIEAGRNLARSGQLSEAVDHFRQALEVDPRLELHPEIEASHFAALGLIQRGQRLAEAGQVEQALAVLVQAETLDPWPALSRIDLAGAYSVLCEQAQSENDLAPAVRPACQRAAALATQTDDFDLNYEVCWTISLPELVEEVRPACQHAAALVEGMEDLTRVYQVCLMRQVEALIDTAGPACERVEPLTGETTLNATAAGTRVVGAAPADGSAAFWRFAGMAGQIVTIRLESTNSSPAPYLLLLSPSGKVLAQHGNAGKTTSLIELVTLPKDGLYTIVVRGGGNGAGAYVLTLLSGPG